MNRNAIGVKELIAIDGKDGVTVANRVRETSPALADALTDFAFGEIFSRAELGRAERELASVAVLGALGGAEPQLRVHLEAALNVGVDADELIGLAEHLAVYAGFPRALNLLRDTRQVLDARGVAHSPPARRVVLRNQETLVSDSGGGQQALVLVHALGVDRRMWRDVVPALARNFRVISYDLRGHGHAAGARDISLDAFAADLGALMDALSIDRAVVVGLSLGGAIAQTFALRNPRRLAGLGLVATTAWPQPAFAERALAAERDGMEAQIASTLTRWFTGEALAKNGWAVRYARDRVRRAFTADWAESWRALATIDVEARLPAVEVPTAVIAGELDRSTSPELMRRLASLFPKASFDVVERAPHMLSLEAPEALAEVLTRRFAR